LSPLFDLNQVSVEHRYFGTSVPDSQFDFLNIWQAAQDHHVILQALKSVYPGNWISSGASKGGNAAVFHRRFFPEDVVGTVAYVTPILLQEEDSRYLTYYENQGTADCREKIRNYQRNVLEKIDSVTLYFDDYIAQVNQDYGTSITFEILDYKGFVYHSIREDYPFEFWSSETASCNSIPDIDASAVQLFEHYVEVMDIFLFFSDWGVNFWTPYAYQAKTELGNYAFDLSHLSDLEMNIPQLVEFPGISNFDSSVMQDILSWFESEATEVILIYGAEDPWSIASIPNPAKESVIWIMNPNTKHSTRIEDLLAYDKDKVMDRINSWIE
ncbi:MAG: hypothetical protein HKN16_13715, partial [Saprospiraceae bacterium]|nr:hypothetical protein [Saprospiraceae bacterium]